MSSPKLVDSTVKQGVSAPAEEAPLERQIPFWSRYNNRLIASEISRMSRYYTRVIQWKPRSGDARVLLASIDAPRRSVVNSFDELPDLRAEAAERTLVLLNGNVNHAYDIEGMLAEIRPKLARTSRLVLVAYNPYYRWLYSLANLLGLRRGEEPDTFVTRVDLLNLAKLAGYEVVRIWPVAHFPFWLFGFGSLINRVFPALPIVRWLGLASVIVLRPIVKETQRPSLSIVIPARNEKGNIENALKRMPAFGGAEIEIIYVEGHSSDDTWEEIQRVMGEYADRFELLAFQQAGKGKVDAVRLGFSHASKDLLVILDADLTMPPEQLERFYEAYRSGYADFINGSRLVYPMEGAAMRFLNHLGNIFFAKALSFVLDQRIGDSLCGIKLVSRADYDRFSRWRDDFGDFDPFGDFELLFPASTLGLGIVDIPIRYRDRTYGSTNISRFYHGMILLRMTFTGLFRIKFGQVGPPRQAPR